MWEAYVQHGRQAVARSDLKCRADLLTEELQFLRSARPETLGRVVALYGQSLPVFLVSRMVI